MPDKENVVLSIGIFAWNEEGALPATLQSLFRQSLFNELLAQGMRCEVVVVGNGCTDGTARVAAELLYSQQRQHPCGASILWQVADLRQRGKTNAWNQFVHSLSGRSADVLFMMDADVLLHHEHTMWNMWMALKQNPEANIAVDRPCKDIQFKRQKTFRERLSLSASKLTSAASGQLCGQLYCMRAGVARNIFLPKDLAACEDGFIKALACTDFLKHEVWPRRIIVAEGAEHTFEAYTCAAAIFRNQKRQAIGQAIVHILVDKFLNKLPLAARRDMARTLRTFDESDPPWLKRLIGEHLCRTRWFWKLCPGLVFYRFSRLRNLRGAQRLLCLPLALAGVALAFLASFSAYRSLKSGCTDYWPKAQRAGFEGLAGAIPQERQPYMCSEQRLGTS
jgi:hypothetical protein